jgi:hypothetical protein
LEVEQTAALEMLDEEHERLPNPPTDHNVYSLGSIGGHNVVIAGLYQPGNNPAATVVTQMRMTFPNLRFGLLVGIGGGVPVKTDNGMIRLGEPHYSNVSPTPVNPDVSSLSSIPLEISDDDTWPQQSRRPPKKFSGLD